MTSFEIDIVDNMSLAATSFMAKVSKELQRAFLHEKRTRKITQQAVANEIGSSRAVVNRQLHGLENISARRIGELFWAMGWEIKFEAVRIPDDANDRQRPKLKLGYVDSSDGQPLVRNFRISSSAG